MTIRLPNNVRFISRGWLNSNSLLFLGDAPLLIDSGYESHAPATIDLIHANDVSVADLAMIVHTHCHSDHIGGTHTLRAQSRAKTAMHPIEAAWLRTGERRFTWIDYLDQNATFFPIDIELNEGDLLRAGDVSLRIFHTPGHSPGGISLYCPELNLIFSGDTVWLGDMGAVNIAMHGETAFFHALASLDKLAALDAHAIFPGHGKPIHDVAANFHRVRERLKGFIANPKKMAWHALKQYFIFTLMLKDGVRADELAAYIERIPAFVDYAERYLDTEPRVLLSRLLDELSSRGHIVLRDGVWHATGPK
ncbi:Hydroxyacylglutathione hydrolase GloC [Anaerolineae bacterium]|nr:Hydroxyacylglutathione hydrolase GloC [Anaerolineae bacterium]